MKRIASARILALALAAAAPTAMAGNERPFARVETLVDERFGITYADPYRWMENTHDPELSVWLDDEERYTATSVGGTTFEALVGEFTALQDTEAFRFGPTAKDIERRMLRIRPRHELRSSPEAVGIDWGTPSSPTGKYQAVTDSETGSDLEVVKIQQGTDGGFLSDVLTMKFGTIMWDADETSFVYLTDRDGRLGGTTPIIRRHELGSRQIDDDTIYEAERADIWLSLFKLGDQAYLMRSDENGDSLDTIDLATGALSPVIPAEPGSLELFDFADGKLWFVSYRDLGTGQIVTFDLATSTFATVVGSGELAIESATRQGGDLFISYIRDAASEVVRIDSAGARTTLALPGLGWAWLDASEQNLDVYLMSYDKNTLSLRFNRQTGALDTLAPAVPTPFPVTATREFYQADGLTPSAVPVWVIRRSDVALTPETPVYLYGYGGFAVNILPWFDETYVPWLERGGAVAIATLPGGREYGEAWHRQGNLTEKVRVFDAFAAAGQFLIGKGWTSSERLAIGGVSNGGLLVGSTANLYPHLFAAAVPEVGVMDLTRFQLFTGGKWWISEYGNRDDRGSFVNQFGLSPYHNVTNDGTPRPAILVMTADADDRVVPTHSYKYAARVQATWPASRRALLNVRHGGSHSSRTGAKGEVVRSLATKWAFLIQELGLEAGGGTR
jgi:prolyl oligopeptidase